MNSKNIIEKTNHILSINFCTVKFIVILLNISAYALMRLFFLLSL